MVIRGTATDGFSSGIAVFNNNERVMYVNPNTDGYIHIGSNTGHGYRFESTGELQQYSKHIRHAYGDYGVIWRNDGGSLWLLLTNKGDPLGGFNSFRPFTVNFTDGKAYIQGNCTTSDFTKTSTNTDYILHWDWDGIRFVGYALSGTTSQNLRVNYADYSGTANYADYAGTAGSANSVTWANISGKPTNIMYTNPDKIELFSNTPYIDFHYGNSTKDYCVRIINNATNQLFFTIAGGGFFIFDDPIRPNSNNRCSCGTSSYKWSTVYAVTGTINTSDLRQKQQIKPIDDNLLNAWENVSPVQYKFNDSVESKGDNARLHTGYIAQDIDQACKEQGVDASEYGLFCYDKWEAEEARYMEETEEYQDGEEEVEETYTDDETGETKARTVTKPIMKTRTKKTLEQEARPAGDSYSLRYEEALVVECAYLRKQLKLVMDRLEKLESNQISN